MAEDTKTKRLCSEIQLFDLCERDVCQDKDGRFCANIEMIAKFEAISEEDESMDDRFMVEEQEDLDDYDESGDDEGYPDELDDDFEEER
jgi:hypothetical protein